MQWKETELQEQEHKLSKPKKIVVLLGVLWMYFLTLLLANTFLIAYSSPTKSVEIRINDFGEATLEYILFMFVVSVITISLYYILEILEG